MKEMEGWNEGRKAHMDMEAGQKDEESLWENGGKWKKRKFWK